MVTLPAIRPAAVDYKSPAHPYTLAVSEAGVEDARLRGTIAVAATLRLRYSAIWGRQAAQLHACYQECLSGFLPVELPDEVFVGFEQEKIDQIKAETTDVGLRWFFSADDGPRPGSSWRFNSIEDVEFTLTAKLRWNAVGPVGDGICPGPGYTFPYVEGSGEFDTGSFPIWSATQNINPGPGDSFEVTVQLDFSQYVGTLYWSLGPATGLGNNYLPSMLPGPQSGFFCVDAPSSPSVVEVLTFTVAADIAEQDVYVLLTLSELPVGGGIAAGFLLFLNPS